MDLVSSKVFSVTNDRQQKSMASRLTDASPPDDIDQLLYLKNAQGLYRGFKTGYISQNLTEVEGYLVTCKM